MAVNAVDFLNPPGNPVQALADAWETILQLDAELVKLREAEEAAHQAKDELERGLPLGGSSRRRGDAALCLRR